MEKTIIFNRKVSFDYIIDSTFDAGIELRGSEIKALRQSRVSIADAFVTVDNNRELMMRNCIIEPVVRSVFSYHDSKRPKKLLALRKEIERLWGLQSLPGTAFIPLKLFFNDRGFAKVTIAICKGKKQFDKRREIKKRDEERDLARSLINKNRSLNKI